MLFHSSCGRCNNSCSSVCIAYKWSFGWWSWEGSILWSSQWTGCSSVKWKWPFCHQIQQPHVAQIEIRFSLMSPLESFTTMDPPCSRLFFQWSIQISSSAWIHWNISRIQLYFMSIPTMFNLETAGLGRSPQIAKKNKSRMSFTTIITNLFAFGVVLSLRMPLTFTLSTDQATVNSFIHCWNIANFNFNFTINAIPHMILASGKCPIPLQNLGDIFRPRTCLGHVLKMSQDIYAKKVWGPKVIWEHMSCPFIPWGHNLKLK